MIKFKIEEKEYNVPDIISIENYAKIYRIKDLFSQEYFAAKIISLVCGPTVEELLQTDYQEINYLATYIMGLFPLDAPEFVDRFELNGVHYGFFPNWKDLSYAEFVDMDTISSKPINDLLDLMHILCAIMYRPIISEKTKHDYQIEKYDVNSMKIRAELFKKELSVRYVLGAQSFFISFVSKYLSYSQLSSMKKISTLTKIKLIWKMRRLITAALFKKYTGGSLSSIELHQMILQSMSKSIKKI